MLTFVRYNYIVALRNIIKNGARSISLLLIVAGCASLTMLVGGFYKILFDDIWNRIIEEEGHVQVNFTRDVEYDSIAETMNSIPGIKHVDLKREASGLIGLGEKSAVWYGEATATVDFDGNITIWGKFDTKGLKTISIGCLLAKNLQAHVGDTINILHENDGYAFIVSKIVETEAEELDRLYVSFPLQCLWERGNNSLVSTINVHTVTEDKIAETKNNIKDNLETILGDRLKSIKTIDETGSHYTSIVDIYTHNYQYIIVVLLITTFLSILASIYLAVMERRKEFGVKRAVGETRFQTVITITTEGIIIGIIGFILGFFFFLVARGAVNTMGGFQMPPPPTARDGYRVLIGLSVPSLFLSFFISTFSGLSSSLIVALTQIRKDMMYLIK